MRSLPNQISRKRKFKAPLVQAILIAIVCINVFIVFLPIIITLISSFKSTGDLLVNSIFSFPKKIVWSNWSTGFKTILPNMINSIIIGLVTSIGTVLIGAVTAYVFVRKDFFGKRFLFKVIISAMLIPSIITLTPLYMLMLKLNLKNTWMALWLPSIAGGSITALFLFYTFFKQQPKELFEAAKIDGANDFVMFFKLAIPLAIPIITLQALNTFSGSYNDFLWPSLIITDRSIKPLMPVLNVMADEVKFEEQGVRYALYLLSSLPLIGVSIIGLKYFIEGDYSAGLKL